MATNNATNTSKPVSIAQGGTNDNGTDISTTNGVIYYNGTSLQTTGAGNAGQVIISNNPSAPAFGAINGQLIFLASQTISTNTASVEFTSLPGYFNTFFVLFSNVVPQTSTAVLHFNITANGTFTDITSGFASGVWSSPATSATITNANSTGTVLLSGPLATASTKGANGYFYARNINGSFPFSVSGEGNFDGSTSGVGTLCWFSSYNSSTSALDGFQFIMSSGDIASGTFSIYGVIL